MVTCKSKIPLSGISGLPHKRFFRPHGRSSVLCGPGKIPCLYLAWTVLLTHHTTVNNKPLPSNSPTSALLKRLSVVCSLAVNIA